MAKKVAKKAAKKVVRKTAKAAVEAAPVAVSVKVSGGKVQLIQAENLGDLKAKLGVDTYQATINGEPQNDGAYALTEGEFVTLTAPVKGA